MTFRHSAGLADDVFPARPEMVARIEVTLRALAHELREPGGAAKWLPVG